MKTTSSTNHDSPFPSRPQLWSTLTLIAITVISVIAGATAAVAGSPITHAELSTDGKPYFFTHRSPGTFTVITHRRGRDGNEREVFWPSSATSEVNSTSCAEWRKGEGID